MSAELRTARQSELAWLLDANGAPVGLRDAQGRQWSMTPGLDSSRMNSLLGLLGVSPLSNAGGWAAMQAHSPEDRETWLLTDTVVRPEWWQYNAAAARWFPISGKSKVVHRLGSVASPLATITGVTAATFFSLAPMVVPAGFLAIGAKINFESLFRRVGASATGIVRTRIGTGGDTNDAIIQSQSLAATDGLGFRQFTEARVIDANTLLTTGGNVANGNTAAGIADVTGQVDIAAAMNITFGTASTNASDAFHCLAVWVDVEF